MILIVSEPDEPTAKTVARCLSTRGEHVEWVDRGDYPRAASLSYTIGVERNPQWTYRAGESRIDLGAARAVWWWRPGRAQAAATIEDQEVRTYVETTAEEVFSSALDDLPCLHVPARRSVVRSARQKLPQLTLARSLGLEVPETLVTSDPDELLAFYRRFDGKIVTKTTAVGVDAFVKDGFSGYTRELRPRDLPFLHDIALCPVTAQAYVEKKLELRVTIVGEQLFAVEIHSQATRRTRIDWRNYDDRHLTYRVHTLPAGVAAACVALRTSLGLLYAAIDLVLTPDGRYVFLEVNPNGQYQWLEDATGLPISDRLARLLAERT
jgi:hypothetical protein